MNKKRRFDSQYLYFPGPTIAFSIDVFGFVPMPGFPLEAAHVVTSKHPQRNRIHVEPFLRLRVGKATPVNERRLKISNSIKVYRRSLSCERFFFYLDQKISFYFVYFILEIFKKII